MYSGFGVLMSKLRGAEDELNTVVAGTATGLLYKSSAGMTKCIRAGGVGFGIALVYSVWTGRSRIMQLFGGGSS
ncbi:hypothetical protein NP493_111g01026 [Ridgeia piscesae]|uniref:Mitochondrial inner membrane translocase subunit Tim17/Tim22/Tim23/peroxisomal protein PMP24 n=1 Tax=Ridgeia piscesae TaxID=27915 RepID=A0AAD9P722_RIDPI|nr:hypothetical protein NP493_111g01026 [Ridgeia piscesae]